MINLIPPVVRKAVATEYWVRVFSMGLIMVSIVSSAIFLFNLPVYVLVSSKVEAYSTSAAKSHEKVADYDLSAKSLVKANIMAQNILELRKVESFSDSIRQIEEAKSAGIVLSGYEFAHKEKSLAPVLVSGKASSRQSLSDFRQALLKKDNIEEAVLPISNLAKDKDIDFSILVTFKSKN